MTNDLTDFRVDINPDRNASPYLICDVCEQRVCTVDQNDSLNLLTEIALDHKCILGNELPCGCRPHITRMTGFGFHCETEDQGYCNFECPHEDEEDDQ